MKLEEKCEVRATDNVQGQNNMRSYVQLQMEAIVFIILIVLSLNSALILFSTRVIVDYQSDIPPI